MPAGTDSAAWGSAMQVNVEGHGGVMVLVSRNVTEAQHCLHTCQPIGDRYR
jgi:hypothetical protein